MLNAADEITAFVAAGIFILAMVVRLLGTYWSSIVKMADHMSSVTLKLIARYNAILDTYQENREAEIEAMQEASELDILENVLAGLEELTLTELQLAAVLARIRRADGFVFSLNQIDKTVSGMRSEVSNIVHEAPGRVLATSPQQTTQQAMQLDEDDEKEEESEIKPTTREEADQFLARELEEEQREGTFISNDADIDSKARRIVRPPNGWEYGVIVSPKQ